MAEEPEDKPKVCFVVMGFGKKTDFESGRTFERNDYYNGINYAFLLNVRAGHFKDKAEAIADFVEARRVREEVLTICEPLLKKDDLSKADKYWVRATMAEAYVGLGEKEKANDMLKEADAFEPLPWMKESTQKQLAALKMFLANSPLPQALKDS